MAGRLTTHPYLKTYDELQRSYSRIEAHREMNKKQMSDAEIQTIKWMLTHLDNAIACIPIEHRRTRYLDKKASDKGTK